MHSTNLPKVPKYKKPLFYSKNKMVTVFYSNIFKYLYNLITSKFTYYRPYIQPIYYKHTACHYGKSPKTDKNLNLSIYFCCTDNLNYYMFTIHLLDPDKLITNKIHESTI